MSAPEKKWRKKKQKEFCLRALSRQQCPSCFAQQRQPLQIAQETFFGMPRLELTRINRRSAQEHLDQHPQAQPSLRHSRFWLAFAQYPAGLFYLKLFLPCLHLLFTSYFLLFYSCS